MYVKQQQCVKLILTLFVFLVPHCVLSLGGKNKELERKLSVKVNPGCMEAEAICQNVSLVHIRSDSPTDSLHFIWSFIGCPTLLLARTELHTNLTINWYNFELANSPAIGFDPPEVLYSFGESLTTIWNFDDPKDNVTIDKVDQDYVTAIDTKDFLWTLDTNDSILDRPDLVKITHTARLYNDKTFGDSEGYAKITVQVRSTDGYGDILPYMRHNGNSSQVDISLNRVQLSDNFTSTSRIGLGFLFVQQFPRLSGNSSEENGMRIQKTKELDDEHTPGVFEMFSIRTPIINEYDQSYLEWKPISYTATVRDISDSIDVILYPLQDESPEALKEDRSLLYSYYYQNESTIIVQSANITFGASGEFYNKTPHISWTYMTGFGPPPPDSISLLVILTLTIGLGIPAIFIVIAVIYLFTKRLSTPRDDLLLGR